MKYKIGNKVRFLNDTGGGVITNITKEGKLFVRIDDGFDIPVMASEVVADINYQDNEDDGPHTDEQLSASEVTETINETFDEAGDDIDQISTNHEMHVYLGIVPDKNTGDRIDIYLINDCDYNLLFFAGTKTTKKACKYIRTGILEDNTKVHLFNTTEKALTQFPEIILQLIFYAKQEFIFHQPIEQIINIQPITFSHGKAFVENDFFDEKAKIIPVILSDGINGLENIEDNEFNEAITLKEKPGTGKHKAKKQQKHPFREVDLHIHELVDDETGLSNKEMLDIQKEKFRNELDNAMKNHVHKIVFIHGKGNGRLKYEIRHCLDREYPKLKYQDASYSEYGFGATLVMLY